MARPRVLMGQYQAAQNPNHQQEQQCEHPPQRAVLSVQAPVGVDCPSETRGEVDPALTRSLDTIDAVAAYQAENADTGPEALLGVRLGAEDQLHQVRSGGTDPGSLAS